MWTSEITVLDSDQTKYKISQNGKLMTSKEVIELLRNDNEFILFLNELLRNSPFEAYFWEVKPINLITFHEDFEFVLINSIALSKIKADNAAFSKYFESYKYVTSFSNLGGDSRLIVPVELIDKNNYCHIAKFVRNAPEEQIITFWKLVIEEFSKSVDNKTKWLSTSGLGVHWLHVRIDSKPKYYNYLPYRKIITN